MRRHLPLLLYGLRLWAAVCLALFVAFALEFEEPFWAATSAAIVCQPVLGASLRKGWYRMLGTVIGAVVAVVLTAALVQDRFSFLLALAVWGGLCTLVATVLSNFASYAAALAGYTAIIVAVDALGSVGGLDGTQVFDLAVNRGSEIVLGIICAGVVLVATDIGQARHRLADILAGLMRDVLAGIVGSLRTAPDAQVPAREARRALIRRVGGMDAVIDQVLGEASELRFNPRPLQRGVDGLFTALSSWRAISNCVETMTEEQAAADASVVLRCGQPALDALARCRQAPMQARAECLAAAQLLLTLEAATPDRRLLADRMAEALLGMAQCATALHFLLAPGAARQGSDVARLRVPDLLPACLNGLRSMLVIGAAALIWILTAWPGGATMLLFAAITVILFAPREYAAAAITEDFLLGSVIAAVLIAIIGFAVLPQITSFAGFCLALGVLLVPAAALSAQPWHMPAFLAVVVNCIPLLNPTNPMSYNVESFYNTALALLAGTALGLCAMRLLPPLSPDARARRLLTMTLLDLRRMADGSRAYTIDAWESSVYGRLLAMPDQAPGLQFSRLMAGLAIGVEIIRLLHHRDDAAALRQALQDMARGDTVAAVEQLQQLDASLAGDATPAALRLRASAMLLAQALAQHASYFGARMPT